MASGLVSSGELASASIPAWSARATICTVADNSSTVGYEAVPFLTRAFWMSTSEGG